MIRLGLTGTIGSGKSTIAAMLRHLGVPVHDSDRAVHRLLAPGGAGVGPVAAAFPAARRADGGIDRAALAKLVFADRAALARLEAILHPLVRADSDRFIKQMRRQGRAIAALDIPLLFESGGRRRVDAVLLAHCTQFIRRRRVLARPGMTRARLSAIEARQMPDWRKQRLADFTVPTGFHKGYTFRLLRQILSRLRAGRTIGAF